MSDKVILIEDISINEDNLEERVYQMTAGGQQGLDTEDIRSIPYQHRIKALKLMDIFLENPGIRLKREELPLKVTLEEREELWNSLSDDEKKAFLMEFEEDLKEIKTEEGFKALPDDIQTIINLSAEEFGSLPEEGRNSILLALDKIQEKERQRAPDLSDWPNLDELRKQSLLTELCDFAEKYPGRFYGLPKDEAVALATKCKTGDQKSCDILVKYATGGIYGYP